MKVRRVPRRLFALAVGDNVDPLLLPAAKGLGAPGLAIEDQGQRPVVTGLSTRFRNGLLIDQRQEVFVDRAGDKEQGFARPIVLQVSVATGRHWRRFCTKVFGHAEHELRVERLRVEEHASDTPVDDIDAGRAVDGAHLAAVIVIDEEVPPLHQLGTHLLRQVGVLEVGRVVDARRQHGYFRSPRAAAIGRRGCRRAGSDRRPQAVGYRYTPRSAPAAPAWSPVGSRAW